LLFINQKSFT